MKLKRILAVLMVCLYATTMLANAAFTDQSVIRQENRAAVELLTSLEIINGFPDEVFNPILLSLAQKCQR